MSSVFVKGRVIDVMDMLIDETIRQMPSMSRGIEGGDDKRSLGGGRGGKRGKEERGSGGVKK